MRELGVARRITAVVINIVVLIVLLIVLGLLFHFPDRRRGADHQRCCGTSPVPSMARILVMPETMSLAEVKARFSEVVDRVERQQERVVVTRNGKPAAVLISPDDLESLEETLAVMTDRSITAQVKESQKATLSGDSGTELGQLRADFEKRRARGK